MSQLDNESKPQKTKEDYSRNVKKLKIKLNKVQSQIITLQKKIQTISNTSNDKLISMKIAKFCKERRITPEMLFRFADKKGSKKISKLDFQNTLAQIGLKLTKDEFMRLEYLIDEDLSGQISFEEYNKYIDAFGIKKEFSQNDLAARQVFKNIDFDQILKITNQNDKNNKLNDKQNRPKHQNLLNYEEFVKYCHKNCPQLKNKELASIFNRLQRNQLISLRDFLEYIKGQADQKKRLEQKNKKNIKRNDSLIKQFGDQDNRSLKNVIKTLIKYRLKSNNNGLFHSSEFLRLERLLNTKRGELLNLFKEIDNKRKGSFAYNQLINYYIDKQNNKKDLPYVFQLMGSKLKATKQRLQEVISQYTHDQQYIKEEQLKKLFEDEFQVRNIQYDIINKLIVKENGKISITMMLELLNFEETRVLYIRPNMVTNRLIFKSGLQALRCCLEIEKKMNDIKLSQWNDYEFGPGLSDQFGVQSINIALPSDKIDWFRTDQLGMLQFYKEDDLENTYSCGSICPHDILVKSLFNLISNNKETLYSNKLNLNDKIRDIQQQNLVPLFSGLYPLAFHYFSKYGIYVIKLFIHQKWKYVIIDNKIPCSNDKNPFFIYAKKMRYSYLSLIQKAYAKFHGNYKGVYDINDHSKYVLEFSNILPIETKLEKSMAVDTKNFIWSQFVKEKIQNQKIYKKEMGNKKYKEKLVYCLLKNKKERQVNIDLLPQVPYRILDFVELQDGKSKNSHKSHRLLLMKTEKEILNEVDWNISWNKTQNNNKYALNSMALANKLPQPSILKSKKTILLNYKLFRSNFNLFKYHQINYNNMIVLRKQLQFQEKHKCRYELSSKQDLQFIIVLNPIIQSSPDNKITLDFKNQKEEILQHHIYRDCIIHQAYLQKQTPLIYEIYMQNMKVDVTPRYNLTFYMMHPRYQLKQRDRHLLFRFVSPYEEQSRLIFSDFQNSQKQFIYKNFYRSAQRRGCFGCC